jgi:hypothetical protein
MTVNVQLTPVKTNKRKKMNDRTGKGVLHNVAHKILTGILCG